jgi:RHS repeat-associated protein
MRLFAVVYGKREGLTHPVRGARANCGSTFLHSYAYDAYGHPITIDGVGITYDALGRMVEQNKSGNYTEITYSPTGFEMQVMNGLSIVTAFTPLPGRATAVYSVNAPNGDFWYRHADWLGSSRLASSPNQTVYYDGAYGPFGEPYAQSGTADLSFTGMNQDTTASLYDFPAREYGIQGRWPSPDPAGLAAIDATNPQSWNRYAYVMNSPMIYVDPLGTYNRPNLSCSPKVIRFPSVL